MAASGRISIQDETDVVQLAGTATFPDGIAADGVSTPDAAGNTDPITVKTGDSSAGDSGGITIETGEALAGDAGDILIQGGAGDAGAGAGGDIVIRPGTADSPGDTKIQSTAGDDLLRAEGDGLVRVTGDVTQLALTPGGPVSITPSAGDIAISTGDAPASSDSGDITIATGDATDGDSGDIVLTVGAADAAGGTGGSITLQAGDGDSDGSIVLNDVNGGSALVVDGTDVIIDPAGDLTIGDGYLQLTVAAAVPTTYTTPLHLDTTAVSGGLYAWDGSAYVKVGNVVA